MIVCMLVSGGHAHINLKKLVSFFKFSVSANQTRLPRNYITYLSKVCNLAKNWTLTIDRVLTLFEDDESSTMSSSYK